MRKRVCLLLLFVFAWYSTALGQATVPERENMAREMLENGRYKEALEAYRQLSREHPENADYQAHMALAALMQGNVFWAQKYISKALETDPKCLPCLWVAAVTLFRSGDNSGAAGLADQFLSLGGRDQSGWVQLIRGVALYKQQQFSQALSELGGVPSGADPEVREAASLYVSAIRRMQGMGYRWFEGWVRVGTDYDSNVTLESVHLSPEFGGRGAAWRGTGAFGLVLRPVRGVVVAEGWVNAYQSLHSTPEADDFDVTQLRSGLRLRVPSLFELDVGYDFGLVLLGGGSRVEQESMYVFEESHGAHVGAQLMESKTGRISLQYGLSGRFHSSMRRDVLRHQADGSFGLFAGSGNHRFYLQPRLVYDQPLSPNDAYQLWAAGVTLAYSGRLPWSCSLSTQVAYQRADYFRSSGDFGVPERRVDDTLKTSLQVTRPLFSGLSAGVGYAWVRNFSTVAAFDTSRHIGSVFLQWRFP